MPTFDAWFLSALNSLAQRSWTFDVTVMYLSKPLLLKGGVLVALLWWAGWGRGKDAEERRQVLVATLLGCLVAVTASFLLVHTLPFRARPLFDPGLGLTVPYGVNPADLRGWGSGFPSDHAVLVAALAAGTVRAAPALGLVASLYAVLVVLLPRAYLGFHYPSDLLAGALLGGAITWVVTAPPLRAWLARRTAHFVAHHPGPWYALLFLASYQIATLFWDLRDIAEFSAGMAKVIIAHWF